MPKRDGDDWILNGSKTFITNGINSDLVIVVAQTDPEAGARGFSLLAVERGMKGFERGRNLDKIGLKAQDTSELFFDDVRVPADNLLGEEGGGFIHLMEGLPQERLSIAVVAVAAAPQDLRHHARLLQGAQGVRQGDRVVPAQPVHARRDGDRGRASPRSTSTRPSPSTTPAASTSRTPRWPSGGRPSCRSGSSTSACSCTAATATCWSSRSPRRSRTRGCRPSTAARPRS